MISVNLVYVDLNQTVVRMVLSLEHNATVYDALITSGIYSLHPETKDLPIGIFSRQVSLEQILKEGDRIEIYRPLIWDPKEKRRQKARIVREKKNH